MTGSNDQHDHGRLDENLDQLLKAGKPAPGMPGELKARIRSRLDEVRSETARSRTVPGRWAGWTIAAAAVLAFFLTIFWPGGSKAAISWADVLEQLEQIRTVAARTCTRISTTAGTHTNHRSRIYFKDPGFSRTELYAPDANLDSHKPELTSITIIRREPGLAEQLILHPGSGVAERLTHTFRTRGPEPPARPIIDLASESWNRLRRITSEETRLIGEKVINGMAAVGFEAPARAFFGSSGGPASEGRLQVWAGRDNAVPLLIELEFLNREGGQVRTELSDIEWNIPLEESLFDLIVPVDWRLSRMRVESVEYSDTRLAPHVTLRIGLMEQDPLAGTGNVAGVVRGERITHPETNIPDTVRITIELEPEAARRLQACAEAHPEKLIVVDFNGELKVVPKLDADHPDRVSFDLSLLGHSLAELEKSYFVSP